MLSCCRLPAEVESDSAYSVMAIVHLGGDAAVADAGVAVGDRPVAHEPDVLLGRLAFQVPSATTHAVPLPAASVAALAHGERWEHLLERHHWFGQSSVSASVVRPWLYLLLLLLVSGQHWKPYWGCLHEERLEQDCELDEVH